MKTYYPDEIQRKWYLIDANGKVLGRMATKIAAILRGKDKGCFTPNGDTGDHVVVINAEKVALTGKKREKKEYFSHSGFPGAGKKIKFKTLIARAPEKVLMIAVRGMLPHNRLGRTMLHKLKVYRGKEHPHSAQKPVVIDG